MLFVTILRLRNFLVKFTHYAFFVQNFRITHSKAHFVKIWRHEKLPQVKIPCLGVDDDNTVCSGSYTPVILPLPSSHSLAPIP